MRKVFLTILAMLTVSCASAPEKNVTQVSEPSSENVQASSLNRPGEDYDELWGEKVPDPYRWLEDASRQDVQDWMKIQDSSAREWLSKLPKRGEFEKKLSELLYVPSVSTPVVRSVMAYYFARGPKDEKSILYVKNLSMENPEPIVVLDPNTMSSDGSVSIGGFYPSPSARYVAYTVKQNNADKAVVRIYDMHDGVTIDEKIEGGRYADPEWSADSSEFYYTWFPTDESIPIDERPGLTEIRVHRIGTRGDEDKVIVKALHDPTKFHYLIPSEDTHWFAYMIQDGWNGNSLKLQNHRQNAGEDDWIEVPTEPNTSYQPIFTQDAMYLLTNERASRYKIVKIPLTDERPDVSKSKWVDVIPESDAVIENFAIVGGKLFVVTLKDVVNALDVYDLEGKHLKTIALPDRGSIGGLSGRLEDSDLYFKLTSFKLPASVYRLDANTLELSLWEEIQTPAQTQDIISEQFFATSKDGTRVPYFVLRHRNTPIDATAKTIIYGYGGFTVSITPSFNPAIYAWLEAGGIYVYSNLRGGSEYGEQWHQAGMGANKQNVFDDYYAVAEDLIARGYTRKSSLAAYGGSNGGLLTGAALTQRPDLYGAIVCAVPLLDMIRYQKFGSGRTWIGEYGNAENSEQEFKTIRAYSPYANVHQTAYPAVLFLGADSDDRVDPMHARKMTAAIQDATTSARPVLLRIEKNAGHGGADLTRQRIAQFADMFSFVWETLE